MDQKLSKEQILRLQGLIRNLIYPMVWDICKPNTKAIPTCIAPDFEYQYKNTQSLLVQEAFRYIKEELV